MKEQREHLRGTFDHVADTYRDARPGYPAELYTLLADRCGLLPGIKVLEIGAGTGQATAQLLERGVYITAIEPGAAMVQELLARISDQKLRVINSNFEDAAVDEAAYDIVASATAFHWVDPTVRFTKSAYILRDQGWLAIWSNRYGDPDRPDPFRDAVQPLIERYAPELTRSSTAASFHPVDEQYTDGGAGFSDAEEYVFRWECRHTPQQVRRLFSTFSDWIALPAQKREPLLDAIEETAQTEFGVVTRPYRTVVQLRRRSPRT